MDKLTLEQTTELCSEVENIHAIHQCVRDALGVPRLYGYLAPWTLDLEHSGSSKGFLLCYTCNSDVPSAISTPIGLWVFDTGVVGESRFPSLVSILGLKLKYEARAHPMLRSFMGPDYEITKIHNKPIDPYQPRRLPAMSWDETEQIESKYFGDIRKRR